MILPIYLYGQPVLRQEADDVDEKYPDLKKLVENMYETMYESDGVGLAAPQIGLPIRLIVIDADVLKDTFPELEGVKMTLVNPELDILTDSPTVSRSEGCLSLPNMSAPVVRAAQVTCQYTDAHGMPQIVTARGAKSFPGNAASKPPLNHSSIDIRLLVLHTLKISPVTRDACPYQHSLKISPPK